MIPFKVISWNQDFMAGLGDWLVKQDELSEFTIIFPHNRPRRYLKRHFANHPGLKRPVRMPKMISVADLLTELRRTQAPLPTAEARRLDLAGLLYDLVNNLGDEHDSGLLHSLPRLSRDAFLPWGVRLASLLEELLRQGLTPQALHHMQGDVGDFAAGLLENLDTIYRAYLQAVEERQWSTPGTDCRFVIEHLEAMTQSLPGPMVAAGFYALSGVEKALFHRLWDDGKLHVLWHTDPAVALGERPHFACTEHVRWKDSWMAQVELLGRTTDDSPSIHFVEGFDRHSQLSALTAELNEMESDTETAVVLPDTGALLPVLHHLPDRELNISMGYPLDRTALARLLETILSIQENKGDDGRIYWRDLLALIRHPYLKMLGLENGAEIRRVFHVWEASARRGEKYIDPFLWEPAYETEPLEDISREPTEPLRRAILNACINGFAGISSLSQLAAAISQLSSLLHQHGEHLWHTHLVDAECLFRLVNSVIPELRGAATAEETFSQPILFATLRQLLSTERVSFEPEPLAGLQIIGVLETRLLHFRRIFIMDAVEDLMPGSSPFDPLLPDSLRSLLKLPDSRERDAVAAYNFYRLIQGAEDVTILYQNGIQPGVLDNKSVRSRFIEQLLWEREKQSGDIIKPGGDVIHTVAFPARPTPSGTTPIEMTPELSNRLKAKLVDKGLSPSRLDTYMNCPKKFLYSYVMQLRGVEGVEDDTDRAEFGSVVHQVLKDFLAPYRGKRLVPSTLPSNMLTEQMDDALDKAEFYQRMPFDARIALRMAARIKLARFLASQSNLTRIDELEVPRETTIDLGDIHIPLRGYLDRVDHREEGAVVLDYKTGSAARPSTRFWQDTELWDRLLRWTHDGNDDPLGDLAKSVGSVQLPAYLHMQHQATGEIPHDAAWINLGTDGGESWLFGKKWTTEEREESILDTTPGLLQFLCRHLTGAERFHGYPGRQCEYCDFARLCGQ